MMTQANQHSKEHKEDFVRNCGEAIDKVHDLVAWPRQPYYSLVQMRSADLKRLAILLEQVIMRLTKE